MVNLKIEENRIYGLDDNGKVIAEILYPETSPNVYTITYTFVDESLQGQGIGNKLVSAAIFEINKKGGLIEATCSYAKKWLKDHWIGDDDEILE